MASRLPDLNGNAFHHGIVLHRGLSSRDAKATHVDRVAGLREPADYRFIFERWQTSLRELRRTENGAGATVFAQLQTSGRLVVGLGGESVVETSIALHHTYGVPYIPGSALKGVARRFARQALGDSWAEGTHAFNLLFGVAGEQAFRGIVTFHDALPTPGAWNLYPDTITVHHPKYYTGDPPRPPADDDNPTPVPLLTATGQFVLPLTGPLAWVHAAAQILQLALSECGAGAKTAIGYGRMKLTADWLSGKASSAMRTGVTTKAAEKFRDVRVDRFALNKGNPQQYATARIIEDNTRMNIVAAKTIGGMDEITKRNGKGPAVCTVKLMGGNEWHVVSLRLLES